MVGCSKASAFSAFLLGAYCSDPNFNAHFILRVLLRSEGPVRRTFGPETPETKTATCKYVCTVYILSSPPVSICFNSD